MTRHGVPPFDDYTLNRARTVIYREVDGALKIFVFLDDKWIVSPCPAPRPRHYEEIIINNETHSKTWLVTFKLNRDLWPNGPPPFAPVKVYERSSLLEVSLAWARGESQHVLKQVADRFAGLRVVDLCSMCHDLESQAVSVGGSFLCWWCARGVESEPSVPWPRQHHSLRGKNWSWRGKKSLRGKNWS